MVEIILQLSLYLKFVGCFINLILNDHLSKICCISLQGSSIYSDTAAANYGSYAVFDHIKPKVPAQRLGTVEEVYHFMPSFILHFIDHLFCCVFFYNILRPNKALSVFQITGAKILGRVGSRIFSGKKIIVCILKGISPFKMHKIIFFPENLKKSRFYQL